MFDSPPQIRKAGPNLQKAESATDLSSNATTSIKFINKKVQHSPKRQQIALPGNLIASELKINVNELSALNNKSASSTNVDDKKNNESASTTDVNKINSDVGQCLVQTGLDRYITVTS